MSDGKIEEERKLDPKWLKGLKFRTSKATETVEEGRKVRRFKPVERELKTGDILSWKDNGKTVTLVTADGKKETVEK